MRLSRADRVAGLPAEDARTLIRTFRAQCPEDVIRDIVDTDGRSAGEIAQAFAAAGYLKEVDLGLENERWWKTTTSGNALAQTSLARPIARAVAFNADPARLVALEEVAVFGSYLDPAAQSLGDLDLGVTFIDRLAHLSPDEQTSGRAELRPRQLPPLLHLPGSAPMAA